MPSTDDPTLRNARREAWIILSVWALATLYCCAYFYLFGSNRPGHPLGREDVRPTLGVPSWFLFGVLLPWGVCGVFTVVFAGFVMADDELGTDRSSELEAEIHDRGVHA